MNGKLNHWQLENTYASLPAAFFSLQQPVPVAKPEIVCFNESLANDLGLGFLNYEKENIAAYFSGNKIPDGGPTFGTSICRAPIWPLYHAGRWQGHFIGRAD